MRTHKGVTMLEVLIALGLLSIYFVALTGLLVSAVQSTQSSFAREHMRLSAQEGIAVVRALSFGSLTPIAQALLAYDAGSDRWSITSGGPEQISEYVTRSVAIESVYRDENCAVVSSGGTDDPDSKYVVTTLTRETAQGSFHTEVTRALRVHWQDPQGTCFRPTQAGSIEIDTSFAYWGGAKQLRDVYIRNPTSQDATIVNLTMTWTNASQLQQVFIESGKVWSESGPGTPSGTQPSGTLIDIEDVTIVAGEDGEAYKVQFTQPMSGTTLTLRMEFADGSVLETDPFVPSG